ncbi:MerR family transcriptional regulator [Endozoicomonas sp. G2_2]|uniref:MerR family transcriptional regulator n=1 Tax=Endozoicomonas sp. G2_2 TaxID=2821092 RepID=UPI001AD98D0D|nr:MerR family transcriptional regulator [Endozoicomonas sp. G2_2]
MNIRQFAERSGVSADTLRYYEKIGVLRRIARNPSGHRQFDRSDLDWIAFVLRLKATGMPLADIRRYAELRSQGPATEAERQALLEAHARDLETRIARDRGHLAAINDKIAFYRQH